ncbi:MFS transporter [Mycobacterium sp. SMC-4]|uniref:MFS transporter n=1 Tax=Mycobacterium sp. SMC-4 TaxID=2857059 RepID=UPI0021B2C26F|nr:MFS transporter [Mycobacterium sp. SMC-4]UXA18826.1 MFS transporter [Mycobacterium sp. SMC-4]
MSTYYVALLGPILPAVAGPLGGDAMAIGLLFSTYSLAQFLTAPVLGALGDRYGRRTVLMFSLVSALIGFSIFTVGAVTGAGLWMLFLGWIIVGASDCWIATAFSYVADTTAPDIRTRFFAFLTAGIASAFVVGPATSGLFSAVGPTAPLFVLLTLISGALIWGYRAMPESLPPAQRATTLSAAHMNPLSQLRDVLRFPQLRLLLLAYLLFWPAVIALSSNMPTMLTDLAGWGAERIATVLMVYGALVVSMQLGVVPVLARRYREINLAIVGAILSVVAFAALATVPATHAAPLVYLAVGIFGLGQPLVQTGMVATMSKSMDAGIQGRVQGAIAATMALAQVVGPVIIGGLYQAAGPTIPYLVVAGLITVSIALMVLASPRLKHLGAHPPAVVAEPAT